MYENDHEGGGEDVAEKEAKEEVFGVGLIFEIGVVLGLMDAVFVTTNRKACKGMEAPMEASWKTAETAAGMRSTGGWRSRAASRKGINATTPRWGRTRQGGGGKPGR